MNKKLLLGGSVTAVVILVLAGLSPVVGYNSVESSVKDSPLFSVRTKRAIDAEQDSLICDYVGKDKRNTVPIPTLNSRNTLFQIFIDRISIMDDKEFNRLIALVINHVHQNNKIENEDVDEIITFFYTLRANPEEDKKFIPDRGNKSLSFFCTNGEGWEPGCVINYILDFLVAFTITFFGFIVTLFFGDTYCVPFDTYCWCR